MFSVSSHLRRRQLPLSSDGQSNNSDSRPACVSNPVNAIESGFVSQIPRQLLLASLTLFVACTGPLRAAPGETTLISRGDVSLTQTPTGLAPRGVLDRHGGSNVSRDGLTVFASKSGLGGYAQDSLSEVLLFNSQIFLHDPATGETKLLSQTASGRVGDGSSHNPAITPDGRYVVYTTEAKNLSNTTEYTEGHVIYLDRQSGVSEVIAATNSPSIAAPQISADGNIVVYVGSSDDARQRPAYAYNRSTQTTIRIDRSVDGGDPRQGISYSNSAIRPAVVISANGRFVAYESYADNIVVPDTNDNRDVFVFDLQTLRTERISVDGLGNQGNAYSYAPSLSRDGRFVAYASYSDNIVAGDTNNTGDIFVYDRQTQVPTRVSVSSSGVQGNSFSSASAISEDGRYVTFLSRASNLVAGDSNGFHDVFLHDRTNGATELISKSPSGEVSDARSSAVAISADGRYVTFQSSAQNLTGGDDGDTDKLFVHDRDVGRNLSVGVYSSDYGIPAEIPGFSGSRVDSISEDGSVILFESKSENIVSVDPARANRGLLWTYAWDALTNSIEVVAPAHGRFTSWPLISPEGDFIARVGEGDQVQLINRSSGAVKVLNRLPGGELLKECRIDSISRNGYFVGMTCSVDEDPFDRIDEYESIVVDTANNDIEVIRGYSPHLNDNGRYFVFGYSGGDLDARVTNDKTHLYVQDRVAGTTELISLSTGGEVSDGSSYSPDISADGRYVVFASEGSNLAQYSGAGRFQPRVFLHDRLTGSTSVICKNTNDRAVNGPCYAPTISADGNRISYVSKASNIVAEDSNGFESDVFLFDRRTGTTQIISISSAGTQSPARSASYAAAISDNGQFVAFTSQAELVPADNWPVVDVYLHEIAADTGSGTAYFSIAPVRVDESAGSARVVVTLNPISTEASSVKLATQSGTATRGADFYGTFRTLSFPAGSATASVDIEILNDTLVESDESFDVRLFGSSGETEIAEERATIRIVDDDSDNSEQVFSDVPTDYPGYEEIQRFHAAGIAGRCGESPLRFCPDNYLRRDVMVLWLGRSKYGATFQPPTATGRRYTDVPADFWAAEWLELADRDRVYRGCGDFSTACPTQSMTRAQLAVFTVIARYGRDYPLPEATGMFSDIAPSFWAARYIELLARDGVVIDGCSDSGDNFCPSSIASRGVAAAWLVRAFGF